MTPRCLAILAKVHPELQKVVKLAAKKSPLVFRLTEGVRTLARQRELFDAGASRTMNSRHLTGHAVDFAVEVAGKIRWDWPLYSTVSVAFKDAAKELKIPIIWGGDWPKFRDGPHVELDRKVYP